MGRSTCIPTTGVPVQVPPAWIYYRVCKHTLESCIRRAGKTSPENRTKDKVVPILKWASQSIFKRCYVVSRSTQTRKLNCQAYHVTSQKNISVHTVIHNANPVPYDLVSWLQPLALATVQTSILSRQFQAHNSQAYIALRRRRFSLISYIFSATSRKINQNPQKRNKSIWT